MDQVIVGLKKYLYQKTDTGWKLQYKNSLLQRAFTKGIERCPGLISPRRNVNNNKYEPSQFYIWAGTLLTNWLALIDEHSVFALTLQLPAQNFNGWFDMDNYEFMNILKHLVQEKKDLQKRLDIMEEILRSYIPVIEKKEKEWTMIY